MKLKEKWKDRYLDFKIPKKKDFFVLSGFNTNVDLVVDLTKENVKGYLEKLDMNKIKDNFDHPPSHSKTEEGSFAALLKHLDKGEAGEIDLDDKAVRDKILDFFEIKTSKIGGQAGIVSNFLSEFVKPLVYTPLVSEEQRGYFKEGVKYPIKTEEGLRLVNARDYSNTSITKKNIVFEYRKGLEVPGFEIVANSDGRFILSDHLEDYKPIFPEDFVRNSPDFIEKTKRVFLSGYQDIQDIDFRSLTERGRKQIKKFKEINNELKVHLELISQRDAEVDKAVVNRIGKECHSLGCDEPELCQLLELIGESELKQELIRGGFDLKDLIDASKQVMEKLGNQRLHIHTKEFLITLTNEDYGVAPEKIRDSLLFGGRSAMVKATLSHIPSRKELIEKPACHILDESMEELKRFARRRGDDKIAETGIYRDEGYNVVIVPSLIADEVAGLVGLGDIISSGSFVAEVL